MAPFQGCYRVLKPAGLYPALTYGALTGLRPRAYNRRVKPALTYFALSGLLSLCLNPPGFTRR
jgi:hypothetical protein